MATKEQLLRARVAEALALDIGLVAGGDRSPDVLGTLRVNRDIAKRRFPRELKDLIDTADKLLRRGNPCGSRRNPRGRGVRRVNPPLRERRDVDFGRKWQKGHYAPSRTILFTTTTGREKEVVISAGFDDDVYVFSGGGLYYVLAVNTRLPYIGLETFNEEGEPMGDIFLQEGESYETLGESWDDEDPQVLAEQLADYISH